MKRGWCELQMDAVRFMEAIERESGFKQPTRPYDIESGPGGAIFLPMLGNPPTSKADPRQEQDWFLKCV
jgi:hypothetical protein